MAVLALGVVGSMIGSAIGGTFLGVAAASWGFIGGQIAGNLLFPQHSRAEGPRIGDMSVQASTYGVGKPILYGTMRTAGNVIFCTDKREVKSEQEQGGKGGPTVTTTTYKYNVDMAVALCEGPILGIRKVWSNGKLIYDASEDADVGSVVASSMHATSFKVYLGDESQLPDPTIEATVGAGSTPAYRGTAYVVFDHLDCPNGVIPQLSFEVVASGAAADANPVFSVTEAESMSLATYATVLENKAWQFIEQNTLARATEVGPAYSSHEGKLDFIFDPDAATVLPPIPVQGGAYAMFCNFSHVTYTHPMSILLVNIERKTTTALLTYTPGSSANALRPAYAAYDPVTGKFCAVAETIDGIDRSEFITILPSNVLTDHIMTATTPLAFYDNVIYTCGLLSGVTYLNSYDGSTGALIDSVSAGANRGAISLLVHADANGVFVLENTPDAISVDRTVWKVDADNGWVVLTNKAHYDNLAGFTRTWWSNDQYGIVGPSTRSGTDVTYRVIRYNAVSTSDVSVGDIIASLCERAGLDPTQVDTSDISGTVHGYAVNQVSSARACIDPLMRAYFIDAVESDGQLKFLERAGKTAVASIDFDDLGCIEPGNQAADPLPLTRTQEAELPRSVALTFINKDADFQPGTETARRQVTSSVYDVVDELPLATNSGHMATVAATLLYDAWAMRTLRKASLPRSYAHLDPSDNVTVEYPAGTFANKRIVKLTDTGLMLQADLVDSDPSVYTATIPGATPAQAQAGVEYAGPTRLVLLDIPLLRDADDSPGIYAAVRGYYPSSWNGAEIFGGDSPARLALQATITSAATMGRAVTVLADWQLGMFDEIHTVDVELYAGSTLASATRDAVLDANANACLLGDEILQFRTATSLGSNQWRLSGLLRGRRGSEWAASEHVAGETFVLLQTTGLVRLDMDLADVGKSRAYEAITVGQTGADAIEQSFTNTGAGLKPLAPAMFDVAQDGVQLAMRWVRRSRLRDDWLAGSVPLGESTEAYELEVIPTTGGVIEYSTTDTELTIEAVTFVQAGYTGRGATFAISSGGYVYSMDANGVIYKRDATTLAGVADTGLGVQQPSGMVLSGSNLFAVNGGNSSSGIYGKLAKYDLTLALVGAVDLPALGDGVTYGHSIVVCDSSVFVACAYTGVVRRYDPATLLSIASITLASAGSLATDGTYVYALARGGSSLVKINPATNAIIGTYAIDGPTFSDLAVAGGYAFFGGGDGQLRVHRTSDGVQVAHGITGLDGGHMSVYSTYVCWCTPSGVVSVIDTATLMRIGTFTLHAGSFGASATMLSATRVLGAGNYGVTADYYDLTVLGAGTTFNLYQTSADVGRGFVATRTL